MDLDASAAWIDGACAVRLTYPPEDGNTYVLDLIDTPGHVDFLVAMAACEGALLLVNASAVRQRISDEMRQRPQDHPVIPARINLPGAQPKRNATR